MIFLNSHIYWTKHTIMVAGTLLCYDKRMMIYDYDGNMIFKIMIPSLIYRHYLLRRISHFDVELYDTLLNRMEHTKRIIIPHYILHF